MKIVALDAYCENPGDLSWEALEKMGELTVYERCPDDEEEIIRRIGSAEVVLINNVCITRAVIDACPALKYISVFATGYDTVDSAYAAQKGILVSNIPAYGTASVAQHAIALLLEICNRVQHHGDAVKEGRWTNCPDWCFWDYPLIELAGKTIGIIGFGRIGRATGAIAKALGMRVLAVGSRPSEAGRTIAEYTDLDTLLKNSDVIALHCPLLPATAGIINKHNIAKMKDGVILINNSRGGLVVEQDLANALNSGKIYAAGLDVLSTEPVSENNPLLTAKNCIITPHISWVPKEARQRIMDVTAENIRSYIEGHPQNVVNGC